MVFFRFFDLTWIDMSFTIFFFGALMGLSRAGLNYLWKVEDKEWAKWWSYSMITKCALFFLSWAVATALLNAHKWWEIAWFLLILSMLAPFIVLIPCALNESISSAFEEMKAEKVKQRLG